MSVRMLVDPAKPTDLKQVHALQNAIGVAQPDGPGTLRDSQVGSPEPEEGARPVESAGREPAGLERCGRPKGDVDPVRHLIVTATGWGVNPQKDAIYLNVTPAKNDGTTAIGSRSRMFRLMASGRSAFTTPKAFL